MFSLNLDYPSLDDEMDVVRRTTLREVAEKLGAVVQTEQILAAQQLVLAAPVSDHVIDYAVRLAAATRPSNVQAPQITRDFVEWGAGPRASQYLILGAKALALLGGKIAAETLRDVRDSGAAGVAAPGDYELPRDGGGQEVAGCHHGVARAGAGEELLMAELISANEETADLDRSFARGGHCRRYFRLVGLPAKRRLTPLSLLAGV